MTAVNRYEISPDLFVPITNYTYEHLKEDEKRNIFLIKREFVQVVMNDMRKIMYTKKVRSVCDPTLKRAENIRLYQ